MPDPLGGGQSFREPVVERRERPICRPDWEAWLLAALGGLRVELMRP